MCEDKIRISNVFQIARNKYRLHPCFSAVTSNLCKVSTCVKMIVSILIFRITQKRVTLFALCMCMSLLVYWYTQLKNSTVSVHIGQNVKQVNVDLIFKEHEEGDLTEVVTTHDGNNNKSSRWGLSPRKPAVFDMKKLMDTNLKSGGILAREKIHFGGEEKKFLYTTHGPDCLSDYLMRPDVLGNSSACNCHVIALYYKQKCDKSAPGHVRYIEGSKTSWGSGRNLIYSTILDSGLFNNYTYFIFMDDDLEYIYTKPKYLSNNVKLDRSISPLRNYERFLLDQEPAVSSTWHSSNRQRGVPYFVEKSARKDWPEKSVMITFDGCISVFHREALPYLLPYNATFKVFYASARYMHMDSYFKFRGQSIRYVPVTVYNDAHRSYPKGVRPWREVLEDIQSKAPLDVKNNTSIFDLSMWQNENHQDLAVPILYVEPSHQPFEMAPKHHPIAPYKYVNFNWTKPI